MTCLHIMFGRIETPLAVLKSEGLNDIVSDAMKALFSLLNSSKSIFFRGKNQCLSHYREYSIQEQLSKSVKGYDTTNEFESITPIVVVSRLSIPECSYEIEKISLRKVMLEIKRFYFLI